MSWNERENTAAARRLLSVFLILGSSGFVATVFAQGVDLQRLESHIASTRERWKIPGLAVGVVKDGRTLLAKGFGVRDVDKGGAVSARTLFAIASNTKAFTAACLAILVDEGKLSWDDPVRRYLPYFELYDPYVSAEMRVRELLCHRSGLKTFSGDLVWYGTSYSAEEVVRRARHLKPTGPFRASYGYSNILYVAAGEVVKAATSGESWSDFVRRRILDRLGMSDTVTSVEELKSKSDVATPHGEVNGETVAFPWYPWTSVTAAGGIVSNVTDMLLWLELQLDRGHWKGSRIFSEGASHTMWAPQTIIPQSKNPRIPIPTRHFLAYGLGWSMFDYRGRKILTHGGGYDGMYSRVVLVPEEKLGFVVLTNSMTAAPVALMYHVLDRFLGAEDEPDWNREFLAESARRKKKHEERLREALRPRASNTRPTHPLSSYVGLYGGEFYGDATVSLEEDSLVIRFLPNPDLTGDLKHLHHDTFVVTWRRRFPWFGRGTVQFLMDATGAVNELKIDVPNDDFWFTELEFRRRERKKRF